MLYLIGILSALCLGFDPVSALAVSLETMLSSADELRVQKNYDSAIVVYGRMLKTDGDWTISDSSLAAIYNRLGYCHCGMKSFDSAHFYFDKELEIWRRLYGRNSLLEAAALHTRARCCLRQGKHDSAIVLSRESLAIMNNSPEAPRDSISMVYNILGRCYLSLGESREAVEAFRRCLDISEEIYRENDYRIASVLNVLGIALRRCGQYRESLEALERALTIRENHYGSDHSSVASVLNNLALVYEILREFDRTLEMYERAISIYRRSLGEKHYKVAIGLNNLGNLHSTMGNHALAEKYYREALDIRINAYGREHRDVALTLANIGIVLTSLRQYSEAEKVLLESLEIREKVLGGDHPEVSLSLNSLANVYMQLQEYSKAEALYARSLDILRNRTGLDNYQAAIGINNLANAKLNQQLFAEAEVLYDSTVNIWRNLFSYEHPELARTYSNLARLYNMTGRFDPADSLFQSALLIRKHALGDYHYDVARSLEQYADFNAGLDRLDKALELITEAINIRNHNYNSNWMVLSEVDALDYAKNVRRAVDKMFTYYFEIERPDSRQTLLAANILLQSKGMVSDGVFNRREMFAIEDNPEIDRKLKELRSAKLALSKLYVKGPGTDIEAFKGEMDSVSQLVGRLESGLSRMSLGFRDEMDNSNVDWRRLAGLLKQNSALIEYMKYNHQLSDNDEAIAYYICLTVIPGNNPVLRRIGPADEIDRLAARYQDHMNQIAAANSPPDKNALHEYKKICEPLSDIILNPISPEIKDRQLLFIAADDALNQVSFAGLYLESNSKYLIETHALHYLSAARDLIRFSRKPVSGKGLLAMGDPDFNAPPDRRKTASDCQPGLATADNNAESNRMRSGWRNLEDLRVEPLPGSRREIAVISRTWASSRAEPVLSFTGELASEESLKEYAGGQRVIHLATHGYFLPSGDDSIQIPYDNTSKPSELFNPLLRSGLLLAGANLKGSQGNEEYAEDGFLSALEVSGMNLRGANLVVLSACETGKGALQKGEGVYGLRRAFMLAGARTVICALWKVPDDITCDFMKRLYRADSKDIGENVNDIQRRQLKRLQIKGQPDHPYNWAAFITVGDWRDF